MEKQKCPINSKDCCETECAWFISANGVKGCAVKLLALEKTGHLPNKETQQKQQI